MDATIRDGHFAEVGDGIRLHYARCGDPDAPLALLLHGFPEFWRAWAPLMPRLRGRDVIAPDLRGFNRSSAPADVARYRLPQLIADVDGLLDALGRDDCDLIAHDWGGAVAWAYAMARPRRVRRLAILNAPHPYTFWRELANSPEQQAASQYMNWLRRPGAEGPLAADGFARLEQFFLKMGGNAWYDAAEREAYHAAWSQPGALTGGLNYYRASPLYPPTDDDPGAARLSLEPSAFRVTVPTLVIWGEADTALRPALLDGLETMVDDLTVVRLPEATHWLVHEQPAAIAAQLEPFLARP